MKKTNNYFKLENLLIDDYKIKENDNYKIVSLFSNSYEKFVFAVIERYENNSIAFPSQRKIAQTLLCSKSQIEKTIKSLKEKNLITLTTHPDKQTKIYTTCNLQERYLELYGPQTPPSKKRTPTLYNTNNKELENKNNSKITNNSINQEKLNEISKSIDEIIDETKIKINFQTKKNILSLTALKGISTERIKEVILYSKKWNKGQGYIYKALKFDWILKDEKIKSTIHNIGLNEEHEKKAVSIAIERGMSFDILNAMKKNAFSIYCKTLENLLNGSLEKI